MAKEQNRLAVPLSDGYGPFHYRTNVFGLLLIYYMKYLDETSYIQVYKRPETAKTSLAVPVHELSALDISEKMIWLPSLTVYRFIAD